MFPRFSLSYVHICWTDITYLHELSIFLYTVRSLGSLCTSLLSIAFFCIIQCVLNDLLRVMNRVFWSLDFGL